MRDSGQGVIQFGDIYTNGINYWMVVRTFGGKKCEGCGTQIEPYNHELGPVVVDKNENPLYFVGHYEGDISTIKPYARFVKSAHYLL